MNDFSKESPLKSVKLSDGTVIPAIGQGTWYMGENPSSQSIEVEALKLGVKLGMTLIDTAEMYANGGAELVVGKAIKNIREQVFLVSKVYPHNAGRSTAIKACNDSLKRLSTDFLDLYLLHWRGSVPLEETVAVMEELKEAGKIKRWGVSNFDINDMEELWQVEKGHNCSINQVLYHLGSRGIEYNLTSWCKQHKVTIMAYCPIAQGGYLRKELMTNPIINNMARTKGCTVAQLLLAWCIRDGNVIAIPKAVNETHIYENAKASSFNFTTDELNLLDSVFSPPRYKTALDII